MFRRISSLVLCLLLLWITQTGCWSSREIESLALYTGLALDTGKLTPTEQALEEQGGTYFKQNKLTATLQIVPAKTLGTEQNSGQSNQPTTYQNITETGDSILEIFRQLSIRNERPVIGHHLKVIVVSKDLLKQQTIEQLMDFILRDNDIRPSTTVYISTGRAENTLISKNSVIPSFHIEEMIRNQSRTGKVLDAVTLSKTDALIYSKRSFVLQNLITANGKTEFSGAGIIKGDTGHWIGDLSQQDTECLVWLTNTGKSGTLKIYDSDNEPVTYEITAMKSKISAKIDGDNIAFEVAVNTKGRLIETWNTQVNTASGAYSKKVEKIFEERLTEMMQTLMKKLQSDYKTDVAGFGKILSIQHPAAWKRVADHWDETFSRSKIIIKCDLKITSFGTFAS